MKILDALDQFVRDHHGEIVYAFLFIVGFCIGTLVRCD